MDKGESSPILLHAYLHLMFASLKIYQDVDINNEVNEHLHEAQDIFASFEF